MRKLFLAFLGIVIATSVAFASPDNKRIIAETTLTTQGNVTSTTWNIQEYDKVGFFVNYDETEVGNTLSGIVTIDISYDGTNWIDASFYDYAGGATLQTSETISADGWYFCWLDNPHNIPYVRLAVEDVDTDTDDTIVITSYLTGNK